MAHESCGEPWMVIHLFVAYRVILILYTWQLPRDLLDGDNGAGFKLLNGLLEPDRSKRLSASQALSMPFLNKLSPLRLLEVGTSSTEAAPQRQIKEAQSPPRTQKGKLSGRLSSGTPGFSPGDRVQYNSATNNRWVPAGQYTNIKRVKIALKFP